MRGPFSAGDWMGPYQLAFRLGAGGMGEVWAAQRSGIGETGKLIALKLIDAGDFETDAITLFVDEARVAIALRHASIVATYEVGQADQFCYLAMELIRGPALSTLLPRLASKGLRVDPRLVAFVGLRIAEALAHAHELATDRGRPLRLIHRDISPHNILIETSGRVALADFGVARTSIQQHKTKTGAIIGKAGYMAPEQARGEAVDARADLFALGVVLYELATSARLFGRKTPMESMNATLREEPRALPDVVPGFPAELWGVIARLIAKPASLRFQRSVEVVAALRGMIDGQVKHELVAELGILAAKMFDPGTFDAETRARDALASSPPPQIVPRATSRVAPPPQAIGATEPVRRVRRRSVLDVLAFGMGGVLIGLLAHDPLLALLRPAEQPAPARSTVKIEAEPALACLYRIVSRPAGASVKLDGALSPGVTPLQLELIPDRDYEISVRLEKFATQRVRLRSSIAREIRELELTLEPAGVLEVKSQPAGASLWIDGQPIAEKTPAILDDVPAARPLRVTATIQGHPAWTSTVTVPAIGKKTFEVVFGSKPIAPKMVARAQVPAPAPETTIDQKCLATAAEHGTSPANAQLAFEALRTEHPEAPCVYWHLGLVFLKLKNDAQAVASFRRYLELKPDAANAEAVRQRIASIEAANPALINKSARARELHDKAWRAWTNGDPRTAVELLLACVDLAGLPKCHRTLGSVYAQLGETELSLEHYREYLKLEPDAPDVARVQEIIRGAENGR